MKPSLEVSTWLTLIAQGLYVSLVWDELPAMLPTHLGSDGFANTFAPRFILWVLIGVCFIVVMGVGMMQQFPEVFNLPKPPRHPDRPRIEEAVRSMLAWIRLEVATIFALLVWSIVHIASTQATAFGVEFTLLTTMVVLLTIFYWLARIESSADVPEFNPVAPRALPARRSARSTA